MKKYILLLFRASLFMCIVLTSCQGTNDVEPLPLKPNYEDSTQWYVTNRHGNVDLFYIVSTETGDYEVKGKIYHLADTYNDSVRGPLYGEMLGVDTLLSSSLNYYAPYYRQCSLESFADKHFADRFSVAFGDVRRAFDHYLNYQNQGRPFVLAGFSQGALLVLGLLKEMNEEAYSRMVAAYVIGASISKEELAQNKHIKAAQGADDTGVTICYNSARDKNGALWDKSEIAINPVNWQIDETPATLVTETSPLLPVDKQIKDTLTVHLDTSSNLVLVDGYNGTDYKMPLFAKEGNYHTREIWFYRKELRENIALRAKTFINARGEN